MRYFAPGRSGRRNRPASSVTTILAKRVLKSCDSAMTQTPASAPRLLVTVPPISFAPGPSGCDRAAPTSSSRRVARAVPKIFVWRVGRTMVTNGTRRGLWPTSGVLGRQKIQLTAVADHLLEVEAQGFQYRLRHGPHLLQDIVLAIQRVANIVQGFRPGDGHDVADQPAGRQSGFAGGHHVRRRGRGIFIRVLAQILAVHEI